MSHISREDIKLIEIIKYTKHQNSKNKTNQIKERDQSIPSIFNYYLKIFQVTDDGYINNPKLLYNFPSPLVYIINHGDKESSKSYIGLRGHMKLYNIDFPLDSYINHNNEIEKLKRLLYLKPISSLLEDDEKELCIYKIQIPKGETINISLTFTNYWIIFFLDEVIIFKTKSDIEKYGFSSKKKNLRIKKLGFFWLEYVNSLFDSEYDMKLFCEEVKNKTLIGIYLSKDNKPYEDSSLIYEYNSKFDDIIFFYGVVINNISFIDIDKSSISHISYEYYKYLSLLESSELLNSDYSLPVSQVYEIDKAYKFFIKHKLKYCLIDKEYVKVENIFKYINNLQHDLNKKGFSEIDNGYIVMIYTTISSKEYENIEKYINSYKEMIYKDNIYYSEKSSHTNHINKSLFSKRLISILRLNSIESLLFDNIYYYIISLLYEFLDYEIKYSSKAMNRLCLNKDYMYYVKYFLAKNRNIFNIIHKKYFFKALIIDIFKNVFLNYIPKEDKKYINTIPSLIRTSYNNVLYKYRIKRYINKNKNKFMSFSVEKIMKSLFLQVDPNEIERFIQKIKVKHVQLPQVNKLISEYVDKPKVGNGVLIEFNNSHSHYPIKDMKVNKEIDYSLSVDCNSFNYSLTDESIKIEKSCFDGSINSNISKVNKENHDFHKKYTVDCDDEIDFNSKENLKNSFKKSICCVII